jgi:hypothetical protein
MSSVNDLYVDTNNFSNSNKDKNLPISEKKSADKMRVKLFKYAESYSNETPFNRLTVDLDFMSFLTKKEKKTFNTLILQCVNQPENLGTKFGWIYSWKCGKNSDGNTLNCFMCSIQSFSIHENKLGELHRYIIDMQSKFNILMKSIISSKGNQIESIKKEIHHTLESTRKKVYEFIVELIDSIKIFNNYNTACKYLRNNCKDFDDKVPRLENVIKKCHYFNYNM